MRLPLPSWPLHSDADGFRNACEYQAGAGGELQLTMGCADFCGAKNLRLCLRGRRFDAGDKLGFLKATVDFALNAKIWAESFGYLKGLKL